MSNCNCQSVPTVVSRLRFLRSELLYDARNYAYVESDIMDGDREHARHQLADICEEGNVDRVSRILALVHAEVVEMLYPFTKSEPENEEISDTLEEPTEYVVELTIPVTMSGTTTKLLSKLIHEYMVYRVMADWLGITNPQVAAAWKAKADEAKAAIQLEKNNRRETFLRKMYP